MFISHYINVDDVDKIVEINRKKCRKLKKLSNGRKFHSTVLSRYNGL